MNERARLLLELADDELVIGWRDSEWTGIAPTLEEDVAFSSIAQNEIGHARAAYELAARELGTTADELAFDRSPDEYLCTPLVQLRLLDWAHALGARNIFLKLGGEGVVVSDKMTKTVMVLVERLVQDPRYFKYCRRSARFMAHDAGEQCHMGDRVVIVEDRPRSARKRWSVRRVISRADRV